MVDRREDRLRALSAALDGEAERPADLDPAEKRFAAAALRLREAVRLEPAEVPPDVVPAVLAELGRRRTPARRFRGAVAVAASLVAGALVAVAFLAGRGPGGDDVAAADVVADVLAAQARVERFDAELRVVERGAHPDVAVRTYEGTLRYEAPERLRLTLRDTTSYPSPAWPPNDVELVVDDDTAWRRGGNRCPVTDQPACLRPPSLRAITGRAPFAPGWAAPLDLVVPTGGLASADIGEQGDALTVTTTVGAAPDLIDGLVGLGSFRLLHADDRLVVTVDAVTSTLRSVEVRAAATEARRRWATTWGYDDAAGQELLVVTVTPLEPGEATLDLAAAPPGSAVDGGFIDGPDPVAPVPADLPAGFEPHRHGTTPAAGTSTDTWSNGRAWVAVRRGTGPAPLPPLGREVAVGDGVGTATVDGRRIVLVDGTGWVEVAGSVAVGELMAVAEGLGVDGRPVDQQARALPASALRPPGEHVATVDDEGAVTVALVDESGRLAVVEQRRADVAPPPDKGDVVGVALRGTVGRYSPALGALTWSEAGWTIRVHADGATAGDLVALAETLVTG